VLVVEAFWSTFLKKSQEYFSCNMRYFVTLKPDGARVNPKFLMNHSHWIVLLFLFPSVVRCFVLPLATCLDLHFQTTYNPTGIMVIVPEVCIQWCGNDTSRWTPKLPIRQVRGQNCGGQKRDHTQERESNMENI